MSDLPEFPFDFEFYNETDLPDPEFYELAYDQITEIAEGHNDIVGASISMKELSSGETPHVYQARVVLYVRPNNISATEEKQSAIDSLKNALDSAIKQVRKQREKLKGY
jgi:ribosome-associated translation inhibitor RaiA